MRIDTKRDVRTGEIVRRVWPSDGSGHGIDLEGDLLDWDGIRRPLDPSEKVDAQRWTDVNAPSLAERTGIDTFEGAPDKVAVSLGALALQVEAIRYVWRSAMEQLGSAETVDDFMAAVKKLPEMYEQAEVASTVAMQIVDNDPELAEYLMVKRINDPRAKAEAWVRTPEGQAFVKALTES